MSKTLRFYYFCFIRWTKIAATFLIASFPIFCLALPQAAQAYSLSWVSQLQHSDSTLSKPTAPLTPSQQAAKNKADLDRQLDTLANQPGQEWLGQLAKRDDVQFKQVKLAAQHWDYSHDGLTPEAAGVIALAVAYVSAGTASAAAEGIVATAGVTGAAAGMTSAALAAGMTTLASQATINLINNQGDLGKTLNDLGRSENVKALVTAMVTAGVMQGVGGTDFMQAHQGQGFSDTAIRNLTHSAVRTSMNVALNGGSLQDQLGVSLQNALIDTLSAQGEHALHLGPEQAQQLNAQITSKLGHALLGCAVPK